MAQTNYGSSFLEGPIGLPVSVNDSLLLKPRAQTMFTLAVNAVAPLKTVEEKLNYVSAVCIWIPTLSILWVKSELCVAFSDLNLTS